MTTPGGKQPERRNEGAVLRRLTGGALAGAAVLILTAGGSPSANPAAQSHSAPAAGAAVGQADQRSVNSPSESRTMTEAPSATSYGGRMASSRPPLVPRSSDPVRVSRGSGGRTPAQLPRWVRTCRPVASHRATDHPNGQVPSDELPLARHLASPAPRRRALLVATGSRLNSSVREPPVRHGLLLVATRRRCRCTAPSLAWPQSQAPATMAGESPSTCAGAWSPTTRRRIDGSSATGATSAG
jgi:hypothetical protein